MATRDETLRDLVRRVGELEDRMDKVEADDGWDDDFALPGAEPAVVQTMDVEVGEDKIIVTVPVPTDEQVAARVDFIEAGGLDNIATLPVAEAKAAYLKGGPLWLHAGDRDYVMSLPFSFRRAMCDDVYLADQAAAGELARDILKDPGDDEQAEWAMQNAEVLFNG
jgi:hypothetical protein